jgi:hypothetical protein
MVSALRLLRLVLMVLGLRSLLGPWPAAVMLAAGCLWWGLRGWHRWESGPARPRALVPEIVTDPGRLRANPGHVEVVRVLPRSRPCTSPAPPRRSSRVRRPRH